MNKPQSFSTAHKEGYKVAMGFSGIGPASNCPYKFLTQDYIDWYNGYCDGTRKSLSMSSCDSEILSFDNILKRK